MHAGREISLWVLGRFSGENACVHRSDLFFASFDVCDVCVCVCVGRTSGRSNRSSYKSHAGLGEKKMMKKKRFCVLSFRSRETGYNKVIDR